MVLPVLPQVQILDSTRMQPCCLLGQNGPPGMSVQFPLSGVKQTSRRKAATSVFDSQLGRRTFAQRPVLKDP